MSHSPSSSDPPSPRPNKVDSTFRKEVPHSLAQFVRQAPGAVAILHGPHHRVAIANAAMRTLWQLSASATDTSLPETLPDLGKRSCKSLLDVTFQTGTPRREVEVPMMLPDRSDIRYYDFVFDAMRSEHEEVTGVMVVATDVTERVVARQESEQQRQQVEDLLEQAPVAVSVYRGSDYVIETTNATACQLMGRTREEALNTPLFDLLPEFAEQGLRELMDQVMTTGEPYVAHEFPTQINRYGRHDTAYWDFIYYPYRNSHQEIIGVTVMGSEVTEQVRWRQNAEREQRRLLNLFEQFPIGVGMYRGPNHVVELVNAQAGQLWGVREKDLLHRPLLEALPELREQGLADLLDGVYRTGEPFMASERPVSFGRQGESYTSYFNFIYYPWRDEDSKIIGVISAAIDVSQRVVARQEEQRLKALLNNSTSFVGLTDAQGRGMYLNPAGRALVGIAPEAPVSEYNVLDFLVDEEHSLFQDTVLPALVNGEQDEWTGEYHLRHLQTHRIVPVLYNCFAVRDPVADELLGLGTIIVDITEQKQREHVVHHYQEQLSLTNQKLASINEKLATTNEELNTSNDELTVTNGRLTRVNADLDNFVYTASHDLKAPITNIQGLIGLLEQSLSSDNQASARIQKTLRMMDASVERFMRTIHDLSDIARLQRQDEEPAAPVDVATLVEEVRLDVAPDIERVGARLDVDVSECGPIRFSPKNLRSIIYNLLSNAVKYHDPQRSPLIRIRCHTTQEHQVLTVADNGLGMDLTGDHRLFGLFRRLHSHVAGTGIGLYIVKKIVENAGGKIEVTSQEGVGTTFTVYFRHL